MNPRVNSLLLAAGKGTRLRPLTDRLPKCLVPIGGRPVLDYWLEALGQLGCQNSVVNTHAHVATMRDYLARPKPPCYPIVQEFYEPELLGSAGTLAANAGLADGVSDVCIIYADQLSDADLPAMYRFHRSHDRPLTMLVYEVPNPSACGVVETDGAGRIVGFEEKPSQPRSNLANGGVYFVRADAYRELAARHGFDIAFDLLPHLVGRMMAWRWDGLHRDIGTPPAYAWAQGEAPRVLRNLASRRQPAPAVFFDRDGTLIESRHYLGDPGGVRLLPDAIAAIESLRAAGFRCVLVSNQSAIGRGLITEQQYQAVTQELIGQLAAGWTWLDGYYHCPLAPTGADRTSIDHLDRKPGPGMLLQAARDLNLDLSSSWMVGDMISDALAGDHAGCAGSLLVGDPGGENSENTDRWPKFRSLTAGAAHILEVSRRWYSPVPAHSLSEMQS